MLFRSWDTTTHAIASVTTAYVLGLNNIDAASSGISIVGGNQITFANAGAYEIIFSVQLLNAAPQIEYANVWWRKNGTNISDSSSQAAIVSKQGSVSGAYVMTVPYSLEVNAGDYLQLVWNATSTDVSIETIAAGTSPTRPANPGIIVTVQQNTYAQIGPTGPTGTFGPTGPTGSTGPTVGLYTEAPTPPAGAVAGDRWLDTDTGIEYTYITDSGGSQWVETAAISAIGPAGPTGAGTTGPTGPTGSQGYGYNYTESTTPPVSPLVGDRWFDLNSGVIYTYVSDGSGSQWVELF